MATYLVQVLFVITLKVESSFLGEEAEKRTSVVYIYRKCYWKCLARYYEKELDSQQASMKGNWEIRNLGPFKIRKEISFKKTEKTSISALLTMPKPLAVWITINCRKFFKRWGYQITWPASWEICMQVRKQQLELDTEQQTGSKLGKEYIKAVYCYPAYLTSMQSTSWEMLGWRSTSWNQDCWEKYQ